MKFSKLADILGKLEGASSHTAMQATLADFFRSCGKNDLVDCTYLLSGRIDADYKSSDLGIAKKFAAQAIAKASGRDAADIRKRMKKRGDLGLVAKDVLTKKSSSMSVSDVAKALHRIAGMSGTGSQQKKIDAFAALLKKASADGAKYIVRIVQGTMRLGAGDMMILDGLAIAFLGGKEHRDVLEKRFNVCSDIGEVAKEARQAKGKKPKKAVKGTVQPGRPIRSMLAQRVEDIEDIKKKIKGVIAAEDKLDGERIQAHKDGDGVTLFSRRLEDITHQYPDVVRAVKDGIRAKQCILDGEAVPVDAKGNLLPFQLIMQRRRKHDVERYVKKIPVKYVLFDLIFCDGESYLEKPYPKRTKKLRQIIKPGVKGIDPIKKIESKDIDDIKAFFKESLARGTEGIICKAIGEGSTYRAGARAWVWIKWKKEYVEELSDSLDLVIVGSYAGEGKRSGAFGALLCASYNPEDDRFETVCKVGSGFTDEDLARFTKDLKEYKRSKAPRNVMIRDAMRPDLFFEPRLVIEVRGGDVTKSPVHTCAAGQGPLKESEGLALRFPRIMQPRPDKSAKQATTSDEIICMYKELHKKKK